MINSPSVKIVDTKCNRRFSMKYLRILGLFVMHAHVTTSYSIMCPGKIRSGRNSQATELEAGCDECLRACGELVWNRFVLLPLRGGGQDTEQDYYAILGLSRNCGEDDIRKAYRKDRCFDICGKSLS